MYTIIVHSGVNIDKFEASGNTNLLDFLREKGFSVDSPCNGSKTCGKCKVRLHSSSLPQATADEVRLLGREAVEEGFRLSCALNIHSDMDVFVDNTSSSARIITEGTPREIEYLPIVTKRSTVLDKPGLSDQRSDFERIMDCFDKQMTPPGLEAIKDLPGILKQEDDTITLVSTDTRILCIEAGDTSGRLFGAAIDIGTTTLAAYLLDLSSGRKVAVNSLINPQKIYGADVISRIKHTMDSEAGLDQLNKLIVNAINVCISALCMQSGIDPRDIYALSLAGNTTMLHLLLDIPPANLATAPFVPVFTQKLVIPAKELGISINPYGLACVLPAVSAYIGADTVAAVLSTGMAEKDSVSLLIDIGTNGEMVLGNKDSLSACSAAAGPAFEGANIRNGMGSISGAICSVSLEQGITFTTIGDTRPIGICGSGLVDVLAQMLQAGMVEDTGRLDMSWTSDDAAQAELAERLTTIDGINAFILCKPAETPTGKAIAITQKDIREFQNAKAAIAAGIRILIKESGIGLDQIENVYLAGGLGSSIHLDSALAIGLIPAEFRGRIVSVGNAAGQGAVEALLNKNSMAFTDVIKSKINYIELSGNKDFNDLYVDCMMF